MTTFRRISSFGGAGACCFWQNGQDRDDKCVSGGHRCHQATHLVGLVPFQATQGGRQYDGQVADDAQMYGGLATEVVVVEIIRRHLERVENAAVIGYNNAKAESINAHIQQLKRRAAIVEWDAREM